MPFEFSGGVRKTTPNVLFSSAGWTIEMTSAPVRSCSNMYPLQPNSSMCSTRVQVQPCNFCPSSYAVTATGASATAVAALHCTARGKASPEACPMLARPRPGTAPASGSLLATPSRANAAARRPARRPTRRPTRHAPHVPALAATRLLWLPTTRPRRRQGPQGLPARVPVLRAAAGARGLLASRASSAGLRPRAGLRRVAPADAARRARKEPQLQRELLRLVQLQLQLHAVTFAEPRSQRS
mmetsp:Transcript_12/g.26  ORF Transcript_12/g.26 Transcript_12/m.26 type:complete len:241 (-) Transcript_12:88-810(-)